MPPDLNSLPLPQSSSPVSSHSRTMATARPDQHENSPSPRPSTHSLAAAATMNAAERRSSGSPRLDRTSSGRRRSQVLLNLSLNDPALPAPGELSSSDRRSSIGNAFSAASPNSLGGRHTIATGDPHHHRQPSLGDIHNELEQEQEAQVNRMLSMIRDQQHQLDTLRAQQAGGSSSIPANSTAVDDTTPQSERSFSFASVHPAVPSVSRPTNRLSRENSSATRSPGLRPLPSQEFHTEAWPASPITSARRNSSSRRNSLLDENAYYQAETSTLQRENQMLRMRIRELERQLHEKQSSPVTAPVRHSSLASTPPVEAEEAG